MEARKKEFYKSFGKTKESVQERVEIIKEWIKTQEHLPEIMSENHIRNFLHMNKFSIERTKEKIDNYYTLRTFFPEYFPNPKSEKMRDFRKQTYICVYPELLNGKNRVYFGRTLGPFHPLEWLGSFIGHFEARLNEDFMESDIFVVDWANLSLSDLTVFTPTYLYRLFEIYQKIYSMRIAGIYYVNCPSFYGKMVKVSSGEEILSELMPKEKLPEDYGGKGPSLKKMTEDLYNKIDEYQERFDVLEDLRVDESKRPPKLENDELLGFHGNFKKIDVD